MQKSSALTMFLVAFVFSFSWIFIYLRNLQVRETLVAIAITALSFFIMRYAIQNSLSVYGYKSNGLFRLPRPMIKKAKVSQAPLFMHIVFDLSLVFAFLGRSCLFEHIKTGSPLNVAFMINGLFSGIIFGYCAGRWARYVKDYKENK